jgi:molybdopterin-guanine dinucleotide biosynthesis protein A
MTDATSRDARVTPRGALDIPGVLLAGGLARRMGGGDKPMRTIAGRTILDRVIARLNPQCNGLVLNANADCPFLPRDLVSRLHGALEAEKAELAVAASDGQSHPVIGLWSVALREQLRHALVVEDIRKIDRWTARYKLATVTWPTSPLDPFFNANTMDDIAEAERLAAMDEEQPA